MDLTVRALFDLEHTLAAGVFDGAEYPWEILPRLKEFIAALGAGLGPEYERRGEGIYIHRSASVAPTANLTGPLIVCAGAEIRHCAYIRGSAVIGEGAVVGNSTEVKNALFFDFAKAPHFNYVGDSIMGFRSHIGAGVICSNLRLDDLAVTVHDGRDRIATGMRKFGAMIGDFAQAGCNSVLNPGTVLGRGCMVYPCTAVRGAFDAGSVIR